jgi:hypothetical protein
VRFNTGYKTRPQESEDTVAMDAAAAGLIGAGIGLLGSLLVQVVSLVTFFIGKRSEERKQLRELVMSAAVEEWKYKNDIQKARGHELIPMDGCIIRAARLIEEIKRAPTASEATIRTLVRHGLEAQFIAEDETNRYYGDKFLRK